MASESLRLARKAIPALGLLLVLALSGGCRADEPNAPAGTSQFAKEVAREKYSQTEPPTVAPVFRWDFSKEKVWTYTYEQQVRNTADMGSGFGGGPQSTGHEMSAKGSLLVKSKGDGTANLVLKDMRLSVKLAAGDAAPETMEQTMPPFVVQGMKEDGSGSFGDTSQDTLLKMLFPLPGKALKVGDSVSIPAQMPFNAMGSPLYAKGRSRITLTRYVKIGQRTCAQLDVDTDISELKVPSELKGEYACSAKGTSAFYFDVIDRSFVSGTVAMVMQFSIDAPTPKVEIPGEDTSKMPTRLKMAMISDNLVRVRLEE